MVVGFLSCEDPVEEIKDEEFDCSKDPIEDNFCKYGGFAI